MKKIDRLLLQSFVGPFLVSFAIVLFLFLMQYLWVYIDEIIGKGAGLLLIVELIAYLSVSFMPLALPIAILIASVMTMGNLAEHYELASMKSAGIPLTRIMAPLMAAAFSIAGFSFLCSNSLIPVANLKARTRLIDIRRQKPSLSLEEGAFNDDFQGFAVRIGKKLADEKHLEDVLMFRQGADMRGRIDAVAAARGLMEVTPDERYFILEMEDGYQYQEPEPERTDRRRTYPFVRTKFARYRKSFDLSEFEIERSSEDGYRDHQAMLNTRQLRDAIDSIAGAMDERRSRLAIEAGRFFAPIKRLDKRQIDSLERQRADSLKLAADLALEAADGVLDSVDTDTALAATADSGTVAHPGTPTASALPRGVRRRMEEARSAREATALSPEDRVAVLDAEEYATYLLQRPAFKKATYLDRVRTLARSIKGYAEGADRRLGVQRGSHAHHVYELHGKYSLSLACFIFLFIGAPMGALIRKGGFGYPILVSILFFALFFILNILCKKLMASFALHAALAAWVPTLVIFPIGIYLTWAALNDRKVALPSRASVQDLLRRLKLHVTRNSAASAPSGR